MLELLVGAGSSQAAHLKKPRRGFSLAGLFGGSMLFESTLEGETSDSV